MNHILASFLVVAGLHFTASAHDARTAPIANVRGQTAQIQLHFVPRIQQLLQKMKDWEATLKARGIETTFFLAAGDMRRAVLQSTQDAPGDVEVLVHFHNRSIKPLSLARALLLLRENGVQVEEELAPIFGASKKIDIFVKDEFALNKNLPYVGIFGAFDGMGDTSLNQLRYSPTLNEIDGTDENLAALADKRITFLEEQRSRVLEKPIQISGLSETSLSHYPETILRLSLRVLRLDTEVLLSANGNRLRLDESFDRARRGFELFFAGIPDAEIQLFSLQDTYIEQFLKLFRGRTNEQRRKIRNHLDATMPGTLKIWRALGLDIDRLSQAAPSREQEHQNEILATMGNRRYDVIRPFITAQGRVQNPFAHLDQLLDMASTPKVEVEEHLSPEVLERYSPSLAYSVRRFAELPFDDPQTTTQVTTLGKYLRALTYFGQTANHRIAEETSFRRNDLVRFPFVKMDEDADEVTLLEVVEALPQTAGYRVSRDKFNKDRWAAIHALVKNAKQKGKTPVVAVDLDGVLFTSQEVHAQALTAYDKTFGTNFFSDLKPEDLARYTLREYLFTILPHHLKSSKEVFARADEITSFFWSTIWSTAGDMRDIVNQDTLKELKSLQREGAHFRYITARKPFLKDRTCSALSQAGVPEGPCVFNDTTLKAPPYKVEVLTNFIAENPGHEVVAFLDDDRKNVDALRKAFPSLLTYQVVTRFNDGKVETFLTMDDEDLDSVHGKCEAQMRKKAR